MIEAASRLGPCAADEDPVRVHVLTGAAHWHQTAFCLKSLSDASGRAVAPVIHDDGSLGDAAQALLTIFPLGTLVGIDEARLRVDSLLPRSRFPFLRERWDNYPHIRKLTGPHLGGRGWKLVLDSDLLFFRKPQFILDWMARPERPIHAMDCETSYGYSRTLLSSLAGADLAERVNVGIAGLKSEDLDWDKVEAWCRELITREGRDYFLEQALFAMVVAGHECAVAPENDYVTRPSPEEAVRCRAVMHHYVAHSKRWYYQHNWRRFVIPESRP